MADKSPRVPASVRLGLRSIRTAIQTHDWDEETRVQLWNTFYSFINTHSLYDNYKSLHTRIHVEIHHAPIDDMETWYKPFEMLKIELISGDMTAVVDALQLLADWADTIVFGDLYVEDYTLADELIPALNQVLEKNLVGARFVEGQLVPITNEIEIEALEESFALSSSLQGVQHHLETALRHLSSRQHPDYANSAKESLSAVESLMERLTGIKTLGDALKKMPAGIEVHRAQVGAWQRMYGWSSDEDGVRHGAREMPTVDQAMAKYTLVTCSAFINLMITEADKAGLLQDQKIDDA